MGSALGRLHESMKCFRFCDVFLLRGVRVLGVVQIGVVQIGVVIWVLLDIKDRLFQRVML